MQPSLIEALGRVSNNAAASPTLPPACYTDAEILAIERTHVLSKSWLGVGRADRWRTPGDYSALTLAGAPVIVLRDEQGSLKAFANTCRHRGTQLVDDDGNTPRLVCPFHGWTYGLDGCLRGATRMKHGGDFSLRSFALHEYRVEEHAGFAFVALSEEVAPLRDWLGNFDLHHAAWPLQTLTTTRLRQLEVACNWKLFLEVFNESYHLDFVHDSTFGGIYQEPDKPDVTAANVYSQFTETKGTGGLKKDEQAHALPGMPGLTGRNRSGTRYTWFFPAMTFAAGTEAVWAYSAQPLTADRCQVTMSVCFPPETVASDGFEAKAQRYYVRMDEALDEDIAVLEKQQVGMSSPHASQGRWSELEMGTATFAGWYADKLLQASG